MFRTTKNNVMPQMTSYDPVAFEMREKLFDLYLTTSLPTSCTRVMVTKMPESQHVRHEIEKNMTIWSFAQGLTRIMYNVYAILSKKP